MIITSELSVIKERSKKKKRKQLFHPFGRVQLLLEPWSWTSSASFEQPLFFVLELLGSIVVEYFLQDLATESSKDDDYRRSWIRVQIAVIDIVHNVNEEEGRKKLYRNFWVFVLLTKEWVSLSKPCFPPPPFYPLLFTNTVLSIQLTIDFFFFNYYYYWASKLYIIMKTIVLCMCLL